MNDPYGTTVGSINTSVVIKLEGERLTISRPSHKVQYPVLSKRSLDSLRRSNTTEVSILQ